MGLLSSKLAHGRDDSGRTLSWWCPACEGRHAIPIDGSWGPNSGPWHWDGNAQAPTFRPSVDVYSKGRAAMIEELKAKGEYDPPWDVPGRCHSIITAGVIHFCADCEHALAGQSVPMVDIPQHQHEPLRRRWRPVT